MKYFCTISIPIPYRMDKIVIVMKIFLGRGLEKTRHQTNTRIKNKRTWIHLSNKSLSSHLIFGRLVPGIQSNVVTIKSQMIAKTIVETLFFNTNFLRI